MPKRFEDKVVIVTGSSSGIGRETILQFAAEGARVVVHGQSEPRIFKTVSALKSAGVPEERYLVVRGAIQDVSTVERLISETIQRFGQIDVLVNNAGAPNKLGVSDQWSEDNMEFVFDVCLKSAIRMTLAALPYLEKTKGNIVNVGSIASMRATSEYVYYSIAKAALDQFTRNTANLLGRKGIRVNAVVPGSTLTNILSNFGVPEDMGRECFEKSNHSVFGRPGLPSEVAYAILFLAAPQSSFTTGVQLPVDGGAMLTPLENLMN